MSEKSMFKINNINYICIKNITAFVANTITKITEKLNHYISRNIFLRL